MQQNRDRNGRPRNPRPYDLNRDVARTSAPSQDHTPRSTGSSRYGYNGEPLSRPPSRSANGSVRSSRADNSIQFPTQSQPRRPAQGQGSNTTQYPSGSRPAGSRPKNAKSGGKQRRPANNARSGQNNRKNQNAQNHPNRQHPAASQNQRLRPAQSAPQQSPARREMRKKRKVTRATLRRRRMLRRLTAFALLLCVIAAGVYLTVTMLFKISSIQVQTADGVVQEAGGYTSDQILQALDVHLEENIFSFDPGSKAAALEKVFPMLEDIRVERDYPGTVVVRVTEARPAWAMQTSSGWLTLSGGLKILEKDSAQPAGLPTLYGGEPISAEPGEQLTFAAEPKADSTPDSAADSSASGTVEEEADQRLESLNTLLAALDAAGMSADVTRIEFADVDEMAFLYQDRISVWLGTLNELEYKLKLAKHVLLNEDGKGCAAPESWTSPISACPAPASSPLHRASRSCPPATSCLNRWRKHPPKKV